jgi:membrane fusion protein (multidrug efflux system)
MRSGLLLSLSLLLPLSGCGDGRPQQNQRPPTEVGIVVLQPQRAELTTELPGRTVAFRIAQVRPQITGIIQKRLFEEGAYVRAGQPLYQIDAGTYRAAHDSAKAAVSKAEANALTAKLRYDRYLKLAESGVVSQQDRDDVTANLRQAEADLATAKAALTNASINLAYTRIEAPISGRSATSMYTEGALVTTNQTNPLTTIQQLDPIYVDLTQSSAEVLRFRQQLEGGSITRSGANQAKVRLRLEDGSLYAHEGTLEFTGVTVSETTGAITLRAVVPNPAGDLLPGMYVRAVVEQGVDDMAILAPQSSVARDENGEPVALVVTADNKVERRMVRTANAVGNFWRVIDGLGAGDRLITEGAQKVKPGDVVRPAVINAATPDAKGTNPPAAKTPPDHTGSTGGVMAAGRAATR